VTLTLPRDDDQPATVAERLHRRFAGLDRAHGRYLVPAGARADARGKVVGATISTERTGPTVELWERHLAGDYGLGVVPVRDDDTCVWGAVDVDVYPLDHAALVRTVADLGLPLVVCRTKSGGAHLFLFLTEPAPAELVRAKLLDWSVAVGYPGVEVFPKQTHLASETDYGNWLNMPYQAGERSVRYCQGPAGALTVTEFLDLADQVAVSSDELALTEPDLPPEPLPGAPPCLTTLCRQGFPPGTRNNALFDLAVYAKKAVGPDLALEAVLDYNRRFFDPPKGDREVRSVVQSVLKKSYSYRCAELPISAVCQRAVCLKQEHGVGSDAGDAGVEFGALVKVLTTPPTWLWDVNGKRLELTTADLLDQRRFQVRAVEELSVLTAPLKPAAWRSLVAERLAAVTDVVVPPEATRAGQLWTLLERYVTGHARAKAMDELLLGRPYTTAGRTNFVATDFLDYLQRHRVSVTEREVYNLLRDRGLEADHAAVLKGKRLAYWSVPAIGEQTESHDVPRAPQELD
jgi:hypothetical protein